MLLGPTTKLPYVSTLKSGVLDALVCTPWVLLIVMVNEFELPLLSLLVLSESCALAEAVSSKERISDFSQLPERNVINMCNGWFSVSACEFIMGMISALA